MKLFGKILLGFNRYFVPFVKPVIEHNFDRGLASLERLAEAAAAAPSEPAAEAEPAGAAAR